MNQEKQPKKLAENLELNNEALDSKGINLNNELNNEAQKLRDFRSKETLEDLESVREKIKNQNVDKQSLTLESARNALKKDIDNYVLADSKVDMLKKLRTFYRSRWGRWTRLAIGSSLTVAGLTSLAVGFLPGAFAALAGRVLMSATGSAIVALELQEGAALHAQTSRENIPAWKKAIGFLNRKSIEMREDDVNDISVYEARDRLANTVAQAKSIGSDLTDHKQINAFNLLVERASSIPENRRVQLMQALNNRLIRSGQKASWDELEALVSQRIADNKNLTFRSIEASAQRLQEKANLDQQNRKKRSLAIGAGFGVIAAVLGLDKIEHANTAAAGSEGLKNLGSKIGKNISDFIAKSQDFIAKPQLALPEFNVRHYENFVGQAHTMEAPAIKANFAATLTNSETDLIRSKTLSSHLVEKSFGNYDGENLSARLNFSTKLHRGDLPIVNVSNDVDGKWVTYYEDGRNAMGVEVADPRHVSVKLNDAGEIIGSKITKIPGANGIKIIESPAPMTHAPSIQIVEPAEPVKPEIQIISEPTPAPSSIEIITKPQHVEAPAHIEVVEAPKSVPQVEVITEPQDVKPQVEVLSQPTPAPVETIEVKEHTPAVEVIAEPETVKPSVLSEPKVEPVVMPQSQPLEAEIEPIKTESPVLPQVEKPAVIETQELPKMDTPEVKPEPIEVKVESAPEVKAPVVEHPAETGESIPQKSFDEAPKSDEVIPHKSWEPNSTEAPMDTSEPKVDSSIKVEEPVAATKIEQPAADSTAVPQKNFSETVEQNTESIPTKQF